MEVDDRKNLYEVSGELQDEYDETKDEFPHRPITDIKIHDHIVSGSKWPMLLFVGIQVVAILILVILLGINGVTLTHLNTLPVCDNSNTANTGGLTSGGGSTSNGPNCSVVYTTWADELAQNNTVLRGQISQMNWAIQNQVGRLLNMTSDTAWKVDDIRNFADAQTAATINNSFDIGQILQTTGESVAMLTNIVGTLSNIKDTSTTTAGVIDGILLVVEKLLSLQNASSIFNSITTVSCADIKRVLPNSPSGYYHVNSRNIYCNMGELCGSEGGWTRLAYLNMTDATQNCPSGFRLYQTGGVRACGRPVISTASCSSTSFPTNGISYSQVCGRVTGYQYASTDALHTGNGNQHNNLNGEYVDGISITRGSPRQHVWTLISGVFETVGGYTGSNCPCAINSPQINNVQSFVGDNYFCESGNPNNAPWSGVLFTSDPLWDGQGCGANEAPCCAASGLPWFSRVYNTTTTDYLELRVCGDEGTHNEDAPVASYEIYIK